MRAKSGSLTLSVVLKAYHKCVYIGDFRNLYFKEYCAATRMGIIKELNSKLLPTPKKKRIPHNKKWYKESILEVSLKYPTVDDFRQAAGGAYMAAHRLGIIEEVTSHMLKYGSPFYPSKRRLTHEEYVERCALIHSNKYDYSKIDNSKDIILIICPIHGEFHQNRIYHLSGRGCKACAKDMSGEGQRLAAKAKFLSEAMSLHGDKLDFSKAEYYNNRTELTVICKVHKTEKPMTPKMLLRGQGGCDLCKSELLSEKNSDTFEEFELKARGTHGDLYDYDKENYENSTDKINIFCKVHKEWFPQTTGQHIQGTGCPECGRNKRDSSVKEKSKKRFLEYQKTQILKYIYNRAIFVDATTKVEIFCISHEKYFWQAPNRHWGGHDCPDCSAESHPGKTIKNLNEEQKKALCSFYYLKFTKGEEFFYKLGITNDLKVRIRTHKRESGFEVKVLYTEPGTYLSLLTKEQSILDAHEDMRSCPIKFPGHTECFPMDILGLENYPTV